MEQMLIAFIDTLDAFLKKMLREAGDGSGFAGLTIPQLNYLEAIHALGEPSITELAGRLNFSKASVTAGVQRLVELGYVSKAQSAADRRVYHVRLTAAGEELAAAKTRALSEYEAFIKAALSEDEFRQLEVILTRLVKHFGGGL